MTVTGNRYSDRARALVGTRFRPQGRGEPGLDCVGLVLATFVIPGGCVRRDYRLRGDHERDLTEQLKFHFRKVRVAAPGDILLMKIATDQLHLGVRTDAGFVHAHAGIGRVVETPGIPEWPVVAVYRKRRKGR